MFNNKRSNRRSRATRRGPSKTDQVVNTLHQLVELNKTQISGTVPAVPDVPPRLLSRRKPINIVREIALGNITLSTAPTDTFGAYAIRLSDLPSYTELTNTYDDYRIIQVELSFVPTSDNNYAAPLITAIDYDTSSAPVSVNDLLQYRTAMKTEVGTACVRQFIPKVADALYSGAFTSYGLIPMKWISCDSPGVFHYGLRWAIPGITGQASNLVYYQVFAKVFLQFRNTR
jgi:hypothetical protein